MNTKFHNDLRFYTLRVRDNPESAEQMALEFERKFKNLDKYDQLELSMKIDIDGFEKGFQLIDTY